VNTFKKVKYILNNSQKKNLIVLSILTLFGMLFEMAGIGILLPVFSLVLNPEKFIFYLKSFEITRGLSDIHYNKIIIVVLLILVFFYLIKTLYLIFLSWKQSYFASMTSAEISERLFFGYLQLPYTFHLSRNSAELIRNVQNEVAQFTLVSQAAIILILELSSSLGIILILLLNIPSESMLTILILAFSAYFFQLATRKWLKKLGEIRQIQAELTNRHLFQGLGAIREVKIMSLENVFLDKYKKHNRIGSIAVAKFNTLLVIPRLYLEFFAVFSLTILIYFKSIQGDNLQNLIPTLGLFVAAAFRLIPSVNRILSALQQFRYNKNVIEVLFNEFNIIKLNLNDDIKQSIISFKKEISVKNLFFSYPDSEKIILDNVSFSIRKGETIGFIGKSGSGKSTLLDILLGVLPLNKGQVLIDQIALSNYNKSWQNNVGYVSQNIYLIDDSLVKNIAFGISENSINYKRVNEVIVLSQLEEFVSNLENGINTRVGERGIMISGGQRQRIGIARALYHDPEILVLDEATSALDTETEEEIIKSIEILHNIKTILIVAHRYSTLKYCDKIFNLENGNISLVEKKLIN
jgi:ABC-type multidrug transport system fused ATPase/permease subunit